MTVSRQKSQETLLLGSVFVEVGNFALQPCNVTETSTNLRRLLGNFEILEYPFSFEHFQKGIGVGISKNPHENICDGL